MIVVLSRKQYKGNSSILNQSPGLVNPFGSSKFIACLRRPSGGPCAGSGKGRRPLHPLNAWPWVNCDVLEILSHCNVTTLAGGFGELKLGLNAGVKKDSKTKRQQFYIIFNQSATT